jgi:two-component system phosphate regulon response regulator PhoB
VVAHDPELVEHECQKLTKAGYEVEPVGSNDEALARVQTRRPDVIVIDFLLPGLDGLELCRQLKQDLLTATIPLVILTSRDEEADIITGLALGVEVYLTRPFSPRLLLAHIQAALRRGRAAIWETRGVIVYGALGVHPERQEVRVADQPVLLRPMEFRILLLLVQHPGQVLSRQQMIRAVQGTSANVTARSIDVHIAALRRKLGYFGQAIETIRGGGYRLRR